MPETKAKNLAGFTIQFQAGAQPAFYLQNNLQFKDPSQHAHDATQPPASSINTPIHKFRWLHVPAPSTKGTKPFFGTYKYTVTPRYFDGSGSLLPIDSNLGVSLPVKVGPFTKKKIALGFTRGFVQSQAFVHHFGPKAIFRPPGKELLFDTSQVSGTNSAGHEYTFEDEYQWLGFTAREKIFQVLNEVVKNKKLSLDVFAYDLNEPDVMKIFLALAKQGRIRMILDNADDPKVAGAYLHVFNESWSGKVSKKFNGSEVAGKPFPFSSTTLPKTVITFSPHLELFAAMGLDVGTGPVLPAL